VLSGGATLSEVLQETKFPRLTVLTSGTTPPNPSELLGSMAAKNVLSDLRKQFDYVIVDSSPLLAVTDGAILAANADGALVMSRSGQTKREHLAHAIGILRDVGATVLGAVFTMTPTRRGGQYSYSYSYYGEDRREQVAQTTTSTAAAPAPSAKHSTEVNDLASLNGTAVNKSESAETVDVTKPAGGKREASE